MSELRNYLSNDSIGNTEPVWYVTAVAAGTVSSDSSNNPIAIAPFAGVIVNVWGSVGVNGVDATNTATMAFTWKKNGTAICSTDPLINQTAGTGAVTTFASGTGITQAVIKTDGTQIVAKGDLLRITWDVTRSATSISTEFQDLVSVIGIKPYAV